MFCLFQGRHPYHKYAPADQTICILNLFFFYVLPESYFPWKKYNNFIECQLFRRIVEFRKTTFKVSEIVLFGIQDINTVQRKISSA